MPKFSPPTLKFLGFGWFGGGGGGRGGEGDFPVRSYCFPINFI